MLFLVGLGCVGVIGRFNQKMLGKRSRLASHKSGAALLSVVTPGQMPGRWGMGDRQTDEGNAFHCISL